MLPAGLFVCAVGLGLGWLALWALVGALTHSPLFTAAVLADHPTIAAVFNSMLGIGQHIVPNLTDGPVTDPLGHPAYAAPAWAMVAVFVWLGGLYLLGLRLLDRGAAQRWWAVPLVLLSTLAFVLALVWLPGLFSQDVFSYVAYGRLSAVYDLNPYVWPPSALPKDPVVPWVAPLWRGYPAPYGPAWLDVQVAMTRLTGALSISDQALAYRGLASVLVFVNLGVAWLVLRRRAGLDHGQRVVALAALAWNPLVLFELAGNAHNDALMVTFTLVAVLLVDWSRLGVVPTVGLTLGALVKYLSGVGVIWVALAAASRATSLYARIFRVWLVGTVCALVIVVMALPWLELPDSLDPILAETTTVGYVNSVPDTFATAVSDRLFGVPPQRTAGVPEITPALAGRALTRGVERAASLAIFGVYLFWEMRRVISSPGGSAVAAATARSCLVYILLVSTSMQTWYFCLPVAVALTLGWRHVLAQVAVGYSLLALPVLYLSYYLRDSTPLIVFGIYALMPLIPLATDMTRRRLRAPAPHLTPSAAVD